jgi:plasmid stability protein
VFLWYCDTVKNITVSVPELVYRRARIRAAARDTSVSALVREFLTGLGDAETEFERRKQLQGRVLRTIKRFRAERRLSRDEAHDRRALR